MSGVVTPLVEGAVLWLLAMNILMWLTPGAFSDRDRYPPWRTDYCNPQREITLSLGEHCCPPSFKM